jgi:death-on-curing protein
MIRNLTLEEVLELHRLVLAQSGGLDWIHDLGALESAITQPQMTFSGQDLYPGLAEKAAALGFSLVCNHPFVMAINESVMRRWRRSWYSMAGVGGRSGRARARYITPGRRRYEARSVFRLGAVAPATAVSQARCFNRPTTRLTEERPDDRVVNPGELR